MDQETLRELLERVQRSELSPQQALDALRDFPYQDLGYAKLDHHRGLRKGFPEVVLGIGKTPEQIAGIAREMAKRTTTFLITRASPKAYAAVKKAVPRARYHEVARAIVFEAKARRPGRPGIMVLSAGTSDIPVAEEAALAAELMGNQVERVYDVGVAGLYRLLDQLPKLRRARALVVVAGMEGALPSVVSGMVAAPVIAVPTSVGYGASFSGLAALLAMLTSCSAGVAVVNIDNGFGAGYLAALINQPPAPSRGREARKPGSA
jgi:NCAIR mutase (PurE)-related protein